MNKWMIEEHGYSAENITFHGNKHLIGNGYLGVRGTLEEYSEKELTAVNLSGIYDQVGEKFREPLNAPNPYFTYLVVDNIAYQLPESKATNHYVSLDYQHGIFRRYTTFETPRGQITIQSERFASMRDHHFLGMKFNVKSDFHAEIDLYTGIDARIWEINGPHYDQIELTHENNTLFCKAVTHERRDIVYIAEEVKATFPAVVTCQVEDMRILHKISFVLEINCDYEFEKYASVYTSKDEKNYDMAAKNCLTQNQELGYDQCITLHKQDWEELWSESEVEIEGDEEAEQALNYSIYHLHCIAPRHSNSLSIPARGLSGQTYKGAVFWDTEIFMLDFFLNTEPSVAKTLMRYRIDTLAGAKAKARQYQCDGAFYAWESQEGGYDACSDYNITDVFTGRPMKTYFKDKQIHISAAVVYGIIHYYEATEDRSLFEEGGIETIIECAKFYDSLLLQHINQNTYELHDVIGPDEYHERVNNNGYTNRMAKFTLEQAAKVLKELADYSEECQMRVKEKYDVITLRKRFAKAASHIFIPEPNQNGVIEQFDGYFQLEDVSVDTVRGRLLNEKEYWGGAYGVASQTQVIKQADVVTWLNLFPEDFNDDIIRKNYDYYEPRTEHGSSLSACMYAMTACHCKMAEKAYPLFMKSATADRNGGGKEWAGLLYIGGTHPAAAGGAYMTAIYGFAGISFQDGKISAKPCLPDHWNKMKFKICYRGKRYLIVIEKDKAEFIRI